MPEMTTAKRLKTYREELKAEGFGHETVTALVLDAARAMHNDDEPTVQADLDEGITAVGAVTVRLSPLLDEDSLYDALGKVRQAAYDAARAGRADYEATT